MKKNSIASEHQQNQAATKKTKQKSKGLPAKHWPMLVAKIQALPFSVGMIGIDIGDRTSELCVLSDTNVVLVRGAVPTDRATIRDMFQQLKPTTVVMETGTHSAWMDRDIRACGHRVLVASARRVAQVLKDKKKNDRRDAQQLALLAAFNEEFLGVVNHRSEQAQLSLGKLKVRDHLIRARTRACNTMRGLVKSHGYRLPKVEPQRMTALAAGALPAEIQELIEPLVKVVETLNGKIEEQDKELARLAQESYPQTKYVEQIHGVGLIVSLAFVLTIDEAERFERSRDVGNYLGLTPAQDQSGESNPELRITRDGDGLMRSLLVNAAQTVMRKNSPECDLKRHGEKLAGDGGKIARKKAVVAVARKLGVLMHKLLVSKAPYNPQHNLQQMQKQEQQKKRQEQNKKTAGKGGRKAA